jgi:hypothetical protein
MGNNHLSKYCTANMTYTYDKLASAADSVQTRWSARTKRVAGSEGNTFQTLVNLLAAEAAGTTKRWKKTD